MDKVINMTDDMAVFLKFTDWVTTHIAGKITSIDTASEVDIYHVTNDSEADFLAAIETAVTNKNYSEHAS